MGGTHACAIVCKLSSKHVSSYKVQNIDIVYVPLRGGKSKVKTPNWPDSDLHQDLKLIIY